MCSHLRSDSPNPASIHACRSTKLGLLDFRVHKINVIKRKYNDNLALNLRDVPCKNVHRTFTQGSSTHGDRLTRLGQRTTRSSHSHQQQRASRSSPLPPPQSHQQRSCQIHHAHCASNIHRTNTHRHSDTFRRNCRSRAACTGSTRRSTETASPHHRRPASLHRRLVRSPSSADAAA